MTQSAEVAAAVVTGAVGTGAGPGAVQPPSRRDRLRAATIDEIIQTARQLLVKDGPEAVSLRAIAREMGMTAPGLYRYFGSYEELHRYLCANIFTELGADIGRAIGYDIADECALAFAGTFFTLFLELWHKVPFGVPDDEQIDPALRDQLSRYRDALGTSIPLGAVMTFLRCWTVLYGAVAMEVFGHLRFALEDSAPMFEITLGDLATLVGLRYPLPG